jgi:predicted nucleic acid-binding protein
MIVVDTGILSLSFRRKRRDLSAEEQRKVYALEGLFKTGVAALLGPIRQELLSGVDREEVFERLRARLSVLPDLPLDTEMHVLAASFYNRCCARGVTAGDIDMMICAAAWSYEAEIFSGNADFERYAACLPIRLYRWDRGSNGKR